MTKKEFSLIKRRREELLVDIHIGGLKPAYYAKLGIEEAVGLPFEYIAIFKKKSRFRFRVVGITVRKCLGLGLERKYAMITKKEYSDIKTCNIPVLVIGIDVRGDMGYSNWAVNFKKINGRYRIDLLGKEFDVYFGLE